MGSYAVTVILHSPKSYKPFQASPCSRVVLTIYLPTTTNGIPLIRRTHEVVPSRSPQRLRIRISSRPNELQTISIARQIMLRARAIEAQDAQIGMLPGGVLTPMKVPPDILNELLDVGGICACPSTAGVINAGSMLAGQP